MLTKIRTILNSENKKRLISNFLSLSVLRGFEFLIPLITLPYLLRVIGVENFGLINFALSLALYFSLIIQYGFVISVTREIARNRNEPKVLSSLYSTTLITSLFLSIISSLIFCLIVFTFDIFSQHLQLYISTLVFVILQSLFPIWFFQGIEKMKYITYLNLLAKLLFLISLFIFVKIEEDYILIPMLQGLSALLNLIFAMWIINHKLNIRLYLPRFTDIRNQLSNSFDAFVSQVAPSLFNNSLPFLLGIYTDNILVGYYSAATKVIDAVNSLAFILSNTFLPFLSRNLKRHSDFSKIMIVIGFVLTLFSFIFANDITRLLFTNENLQIAIYIKMISINIFLTFFILVYSTNYLMLVGREKMVKNIAITTSIIFLITALLTIPVYGILATLSLLVGIKLTIAIANFIAYLHCKKQNTVAQ